MIRDVVLDRCDISILISADSDLIPPIKFIREINPIHKILVYFPPLRWPYDLRDICNKYVKLENHQKIFDKSLLPDKLTLHNGTELQKPSNWI